MNSDKLLIDLARADAEVREAYKKFQDAIDDTYPTEKEAPEGGVLVNHETGGVERIPWWPKPIQEMYNALTTARRRRGARRAQCLKAGRKLMEDAK